MIKLKKLLKEISGYEIKGSKELLVSGITANSKFVGPGSLFIAKKGKTFDGNHYIPEAVRAGASAIATDLFDPSIKQIVQLSTQMSLRLRAVYLRRFIRMLLKIC